MKREYLTLNFNNREKLEGISIRYDATELEEKTCLKCVTAYDNAYVGYNENFNTKTNPDKFVATCYIEFTDEEHDCLMDILNRFNLNIINKIN